MTLGFLGLEGYAGTFANELTFILGQHSPTTNYERVGIGNTTHDKVDFSITRGEYK